MNSNNTNITSSDHSDTAQAEFGSIEDSNSRKATEGGNTPISQRKLLQMSAYSNNLNPLGRRSSHDNQSLKSM